MSALAGALFRAFKICVATGLILVSLWALLLPPQFPASVRSLVNARGLRIKARLDGVVTEVAGGSRKAIAPGDILARVTQEPRETRRRLKDLAFALESLRARLDHVEATLALRQSALAATQKELASVTDAAVVDLRRALVTAQADLKASTEEHQVKRADEERLAQLLSEGVVTHAQWAAGRDQTLSAKRRLQAAEDRLAAIQTDLKNCIGGVPTRSIPGLELLSAERLRYEQEVQELQAQKLEAQLQFPGLHHQVGELEATLQDDHSQVIKSQVRGVVWRQLVLEGQDVQAGQELLQVADGASLFVEAFFDRQFLDRLSVGDRAHVYLISEDRYVEGAVVDIQAQEQDVGRENIIQSVGPDATMLRVLIEFEPGVLEVRSIGYLAKVMISSAAPGLAERVMIWLSFMLKSHS